MKEYILPVRDLVVHPGLTVPVYVDNPTSIKCIESATNAHQKLVLCPQHGWSYPSDIDDIFTTGTIGDIAQVLHIENGVFMADVNPIEILDDSELDQTIALRDKIVDTMQILSGQSKFKMEKIHAIVQNYPMPAFIDSVMQMMHLDVDVAIDILKNNGPFTICKLSKPNTKIKIKIPTSKVITLLRIIFS